MANSPDAHYAKIVADHIGSIHTNVEIPHDQWFQHLENCVKIT